MPIYEYSCKSCGEHLEIVQSFRDDSLTACPACGGALRKVFGNIGISFKGSGFYKTDSRSAAAAKTEAKSESSAASPASSSSSEPSGGSSPAPSPSAPPPSTPSSGQASSSSAKAS